MEPMESERIALSDAREDISGATEKSMVGINVSGTVSALSMLKTSVKKLIKIVREVQEVRDNPEFMRQLNSICKRLPIVKGTEDYSAEYNEAMVLTQLAALNKAISTVKYFDSHQGNTVKNEMAMYEMMTD